MIKITISGAEHGARMHLMRALGKDLKAAGHSVMMSDGVKKIHYMTMEMPAQPMEVSLAVAPLEPVPAPGMNDAQLVPPPTDGRELLVVGDYVARVDEDVFSVFSVFEGIRYDGEKWVNVYDGLSMIQEAGDEFKIYHWIELPKSAAKPEGVEGAR